MELLLTICKGFIFIVLILLFIGTVVLARFLVAWHRFRIKEKALREKKRPVKFIRNARSKSK